ncbi:hypothetical protein VPNG_07609 [Cytospora leucostoma]|uniref:Uncharacterized protein n=1 Tax=Cytospora leucostoma TaxID=1230097 RepID=A0A423WDI4_9PEZI|nr:hypothetical protein VPNG_07609 [Cytospora leucostoma]
MTDRGHARLQGYDPVLKPVFLILRAESEWRGLDGGEAAKEWTPMKNGNAAETRAENEWTGLEEKEWKPVKNGDEAEEPAENEWMAMETKSGGREAELLGQAEHQRMAGEAPQAKE